MSTHRLMPPRSPLFAWIGRVARAATRLPYRPGEVDPRPLISGSARKRSASPAPSSAAEPVEEPVEEPRGQHAAGSRSDLRPVTDLLAAAGMELPEIRHRRLLERVEAAHAEAVTEPLPLYDLALLSHTGYQELLAETHQLNHDERTGS